jgi:hypothetical protein
MVSLVLSQTHVSSAHAITNISDSKQPLKFTELLDFWTFPIVRNSRFSSSKGRVFYYLEFRTMGKVQKPCNSVCHPSSSEPFRTNLWLLHHRRRTNFNQISDNPSVPLFSPLQEDLLGGRYNLAASAGSNSKAVYSKVALEKTALKVV